MDERTSPIGVQSGKVLQRSVQELALVFIDHQIASGSVAQWIEHLTINQSAYAKAIQSSFSLSLWVLCKILIMCYALRLKRICSNSLTKDITGCENKIPVWLEGVRMVRPYCDGIKQAMLGQSDPLFRQSSEPLRLINRYATKCRCQSLRNSLSEFSF